MRKKLQILICGIIIGTLLASGIVFAKQISETAELVYNNIKITLNDKEIEPKDAVGNTVEPFTINGTTYLPVRAVAEALGIKVDWDEETNTVILTDEKTTENEDKPSDEVKTVGQTLLAAFEEKAASGMDAFEIAKALVSNEIIPFTGDAMQIEEGLLPGFGDTEIKGFKSGASFMPMIGSIPFVGYVFELEDSTDVSDFVSTLESSADLRWNICVEADEMVCGNVGSKVFFVMCPNQFEA